MSEPLEYYLALRYPIELLEDPDGGFVAKHPDLEGCLAQGESADAAVAALADARRLWLETRVEDHLLIPEPLNEEEYSGRFVLRVPRGVHGRLARRAAKEGVSLNQYIATVLAEHLGEATTRDEWKQSFQGLRTLSQAWTVSSDLSSRPMTERWAGYCRNYQLGLRASADPRTHYFPTLNTRQGFELGRGGSDTLAVFRSRPDVLAELEQA